MADIDWLKSANHQWANSGIRRWPNSIFCRRANVGTFGHVCRRWPIGGPMSANVADRADVGPSTVCYLGTLLKL